MKMISRRAMLFGICALFAGATTVQARPRVSRPGPKIIPRVTQGARSAVAQASQSGGGHVGNHIGKSNSALRARSEMGNLRAPFKAAANNKPVSRFAAANARPKVVSTFHSNATADAMYRQALQGHQSAISRWMSKPTKEPYNATFVAATPVGTAYVRSNGSGAGRFVAAQQGHFQLRQTPGGRGFYPHTAMLSARGQK